MSATTQGSGESSTVAETNDGSACTDQETCLQNVDVTVESEKPKEVTAGSTGQLTDDHTQGRSILCMLVNAGQVLALLVIL